jgi:hypothetical protein
MLKKGLDRKHVSELDKFLKDFDEKTPLSSSQEAEIEKHQQVAKRRDEDCGPDADEII